MFRGAGMIRSNMDISEIIEEIRAFESFGGLRPFSRYTDVQIIRVAVLFLYRDSSIAQHDYSGDLVAVDQAADFVRQVEFAISQDSDAPVSWAGV